MPIPTLAKALLLPELKFVGHEGLRLLVCEKVSQLEVCPKCASPSGSIYDHRWVCLKDAPIRDQVPKLKVLKRRFYCATCRKPFTEPIPGVLPGRRTTQRFRVAVLAACQEWQSLSLVRKRMGISSGLLYRIQYEQLELRRRMNNQYPWPERIGLDEHGFGKDSEYRRKRFVTMVVNQSRGKLMEVVLGKSSQDLRESLNEIPGRENVRWATIDMCDPYKNFIREFFPQAHIVADKFHVLRLLSAAILRERRRIVGKNADRRARGLLLVNAKRLGFFERRAIDRYLVQHPTLEALYGFKEGLHSFYRIKHPRVAAHVLDAMIVSSQLSQVPEIRTLGTTLLKWKTEILNYFHNRITNARLEGFNNKASLVRRRGYGYRNFNNYRLQLLNACS